MTRFGILDEPLSLRPQKGYLKRKKTETGRKAIVRSNSLKNRISNEIVKIKTVENPKSTIVKLQTKILGERDSSLVARLFNARIPSLTFPWSARTV